MKDVKRTIVTLALALATAFTLCACGEKPDPEPTPAPGPKTYTEAENYEYFKAGMTHALAYDGALTVKSDYTFVEDGEENKLGRVFSRDGYKRFSVSTTYRKNDSGDFEPYYEEKNVFKPVMQDGHERILYYAYTGDSEEGEDESVSYIRADYVDYRDPDSATTPKNIVEYAGCDGADFAAYTAAVKQSYMDDEDYEGITEDKITVTIARVADNEVTVTITIKDYATTETSEDYEGNQRTTTTTENSVFEVTVSDGKVIKTNGSAKADYLYDDGSTDAETSKRSEEISYTFDNVMFSRITFDESKAVSEDYVEVKIMLGEDALVEAARFSFGEAVTEESVANKALSAKIKCGTDVYDVCFDKECTRPLDGEYKVYEDMTLYVKLITVPGAGGRSFEYNVSMFSDGSVFSRTIYAIYFDESATSKSYTFGEDSGFGEGGVTLNGETVTDFNGSNYSFNRYVEPGKIYTVVRKAKAQN